MEKKKEQRGGGKTARVEDTLALPQRGTAFLTPPYPAARYFPRKGDRTKGTKATKHRRGEV